VKDVGGVDDEAPFEWGEMVMSLPTFRTEVVWFTNLYEAKSLVRTPHFPKIKK